MYLKINGANLFFDSYGSQLEILPNKVETKKTLIVLHGGHGFADHTLYVEFWSQFQDIIQVVFVDQHGCGRSDKGSPQSWNYARWASDIQQLCQQLAIEKPILAGVSMGGHVIGQYVRDYPEQLGGIILCNTEAKFDVDALTQQFKKRGQLNAAQACDEFYKQPNDLTLAEYKKHCLPLYAKNAYSKVEVSRCIGHPEVFIHAVENEVNNFDYRPDFKNIICPTLIMAGEHGSHTPEASEEMRELINDEFVTYKFFTDAGSPVYKDEPELAKKIVREYLERNKLHS